MSGEISFLLKVNAQKIYTHGIFKSHIIIKKLYLTAIANEYVHISIFRFVYSFLHCI